MIEEETPNFFKKYLDKDGKVINLNDILYNEVGVRYQVVNISYGENATRPILLYGMRDDGTLDYDPTCEKPSELSHINPIVGVDKGVLEGWSHTLSLVLVELPVGKYPLKSELFQMKDEIDQLVKENYNESQHNKADFD